MQIKLIVSDDQPVIRFGVAQLLSETEFQIVANVDCADSTLTAYKELKPDVLLMDVCLGADSGLAVLEQLAKEPSAPDVVI